MPPRLRQAGQCMFRQTANSDVPPFLLQTTADIVKVLILQLARRAWNTLARLLQLAVLTLEYKPLLAHELANAGAIGVVLGAFSHAELAYIVPLDNIARKRDDLPIRRGLLRLPYRTVTENCGNA